jgi:hypothetical protein
VYYNNKWIHFGAIQNGIPMDQYKDSTGLGLYTKYDHLDPKRRKLYRARHKVIKLKDGTLAYIRIKTRLHTGPGHTYGKKNI